MAIIAEVAPLGHPRVPLIRVPDARAALALLSCSFHEHPSAKLMTVGITGTNGKTTVAYMVRQILERHGLKTGLLSTVQYEMGARTIPAVRTTPEAPVIASMMAQMLEQQCRAAVLAVSSHALVQKRTLGIQFDAVVFTNLTPEHLDYHGNMEAYFEAKSLLFDQIQDSGKASASMVNLDDPFGERLIYQAKRTEDCITYGVRESADVRASMLKLDARGSRFRVSSPWGSADVHSQLMGRYNVSNALAAMATCGQLGVPIELAAEAISTLESVPGRLEEIRVPQPFQVFVDYAHTADALANVIPALREITSGRLIVVFGCGGDRDSSKRPLMGRVASELADFSFLTSDNPRSEDPSAIVDDILVGFEDCTQYEVLLDRRAAIQSALELADVGDVVLIAGKGHEPFQESGQKTIPFDDRRVVKSILGQE